MTVLRLYEGCTMSLHRGSMKVRGRAYGSIKALFRLDSGSIQALFRLYSGSIQALLRHYKGSMKAL
jgi:hypothetical protein